MMPGELHVQLSHGNTMRLFRFQNIVHYSKNSLLPCAPCLVQVGVGYISGRIYNRCLREWRPSLRKIGGIEKVEAEHRHCVNLSSLHGYTLCLRILSWWTLMISNWEQFRPINSLESNFSSHSLGIHFWYRITVHPLTESGHGRTVAHPLTKAGMATQLRWVTFIQ